MLPIPLVFVRTGIGFLFFNLIATYPILESEVSNYIFQMLYFN
jgi:hypothetical protein